MKETISPFLDRDNEAEGTREEMNYVIADMTIEVVL